MIELRQMVHCPFQADPICHTPSAQQAEFTLADILPVVPGCPVQAVAKGSANLDTFTHLVVRLSMGHPGVARHPVVGDSGRMFRTQQASGIAG